MLSASALGVGLSKLSFTGRGMEAGLSPGWPPAAERLACSWSDIMELCTGSQ